MLTRTQILNRPRTVEAVPAPELGEAVSLHVRLLTAGEFLTLSNAAKAQPEQAYASWLVACVCDETGKPTFLPEDTAAITDLPFPLVNRLIEVAQRLNGTSETATKN